MNHATLEAFQSIHEALMDTKYYSAKEFELRATQGRRNRDNTVSVDPDGKRWVWVEPRSAWVRCG